jgi:hypothetical protein
VQVGETGLLASILIAAVSTRRTGEIVVLVDESETHFYKATCRMVDRVQHSERPATVAELSLCRERPPGEEVSGIEGDRRQGILTMSKKGRVFC